MAGSRSSTPRPMLPASWVGRPTSERMWWINAEVVDLPFDPVTATTRGAVSNSSQSAVAKERKNSPMSLSTGTPASIAAAITGLGRG